jgi:hypothetical protein
LHHSKAEGVLRCAERRAGHHGLQLASEHESREHDFDEQGLPIDRPGNRDRSVARFLYEYDARGNWASKNTEAGHGDHPHFTFTSTELRTLTYFEPI